MDKKSELEKLKKQMQEDKTLPLRKGANNLVFGDGNENAQIIFIGEGPGYWEDQKGIPFVGNAGAFLNQLLASIGMDRKDVFITNVVHFRPPSNRDPLPEELEAFQKYLDKIIDIVSPRAIVTLGRFSMGKFLPGVMISRVHGKQHKVVWKDKSLEIFPMYHPAAGLRNGEIRRQTMEDFKIIKEFIESETKDSEKKEKEEKIEQMKLI